MPRELLVLAQERRLLDRDLLDQPRDQRRAPRPGRTRGAGTSRAPPGSMRSSAACEVRVLAASRSGCRSPGKRVPRLRRARASRRRSAGCSGRSRWPIAAGGRTSCAPRSAAFLGMPYTVELASSWAIVSPPARCTSPRPSAPSRPMPVSTTATPPAPATVAMLRSRTSAGRPVRPGVVAVSRVSCPRAVERQMSALGSDPDPGPHRARGRRAARAAAPGRRSQRAKPSTNPLAMCCTTRIGTANVGRDLGEHVRERLRAAGRGADADDRAASRSRGARRPPVAQPGARVVDHRDAAEHLQPPAECAARRRRRDRGGRGRPWRALRARRPRAPRAPSAEPGSTPPESTRIGTGMDAHDLLDRGDAGDPGQLEVHRDEVGLERAAAGRSPPRRSSTRRRPRSRGRARAAAMSPAA